MPSFEDLVAHLSCIHTTDRKRDRAYDVAGHLIKETLKERWNGLSQNNQRTLTKDAGNRLWENYMKKRKIDNLSPKDAARGAIYDEKDNLQQIFNPEERHKNLSDQLNDF